jgi:hypothetical protein
MVRWLAILVLGLGVVTASGQVLEHQRNCYNIYEQMRANEQSNPALAVTYGRKFLSSVCGDVYPTLVDPVKQYIAAYERQQDVRSANTAATANVVANGPLASDPEMRFHVGDRVIVDTLQMDDPAKAHFENGVVTEVNQANRYYVVLLDAVGGDTAKPVSVGARPNSQPHWIRLLGEGAAPTTEVLRTDPIGTVMADRELVDCPHLSISGTNGTPLPMELGKHLIQCIYEKSSDPRADGATTVNMSALTIGAQRLWNNDDPAGGTVQTLVYPVFAKWTQKSFYRDRNVLITDVADSFTCFVNISQTWQCARASGPRSEGHRQEIAVIQR